MKRKYRFDRAVLVIVEGALFGLSLWVLDWSLYGTSSAMGLFRAVVGGATVGLCLSMVGYLVVTICSEGD